MEPGWIFVFCAFIGIPIAGVLGFAFVAWLNYRYMRASLDTLKAYAAHGREPPEALVKALTEGGRRYQQTQYAWGAGPAHDDPPEGLTDSPRDRARAYRWRHRYRHRHTAVYAWRQAFFWAALTVGFWFASDYLATGDAHDSLTIVAIITGAITVASTLGAVMTTIVRANERTPD